MNGLHVSLVQHLEVVISLPRTHQLLTASFSTNCSRLQSDFWTFANQIPLFLPDDVRLIHFQTPFISIID